MKETPLTERQEAILRAIVDAHIRLGEPVGSKYISGTQIVDCSSATVRNEMAELENRGFLMQPHTSAGRVPTEAGYRYYVNGLLADYTSTTAQIEQMSASLRRKLGELDQILDEASRIASVLTNYPGIAVKTTPTRQTVSRFEGVYLDERKFLLVMVFPTGAVKTRTVICDRDCAEEDVRRMTGVLNEYMAGKPADAINLPLMMEMERRLGVLGGYVSPLIKMIWDVLGEESGSDLQVDGVTRLLQYPEYEDLDELRNVIAMLEDKRDLLSVIATETESAPDEMHVLIGSENSVRVMNNSTLVYHPVKRNGRVIGAIGVIGPRRMDYARVFGIIDSLVQGIDRVLDGEAPMPLPDSDGHQTL